MAQDLSCSMTCFVLFFGVVKAWFIHQVGYSVRCVGDCLGYCFVDIDDDLPCDSTTGSTSLKCTK